MAYGSLVMKLPALALVLMTGCSFVKELKEPPFPMAMIHHARAVGIETSVPNQVGDAVFKLRLGWFSDSWSLVPCWTNAIFIAPISDAFKLGQSFSDTSITEDVIYGWKGDAPPTPRYNQLFSPTVKLRP